MGKLEINIIRKAWLKILVILLNNTKIKIKEELSLTHGAQKPFAVVIIDTIGSLQSTEENNRYALTIIYDLSKFLISVPLKTKTADDEAKAILNKCILIYGSMKEIRTDMRKDIKNSVMFELCKLMNVSYKTSTPYYHKAVGSVESVHCTFSEALSEVNNWDIHAHYFIFCNNINKHSSNKNTYILLTCFR